MKQEKKKGGGIRLEARPSRIAIYGNLIYRRRDSSSSQICGVSFQSYSGRIVLPRCA